PYSDELVPSNNGPQAYGPERFNWARFMALWDTGSSLPEEVLKDPWLVDWTLVAQKTQASGFDRRRLVVESGVYVDSLLPDCGPWVAASPFSSLQSEGDSLVSLYRRKMVDTLLSRQGIIRYSMDLWAVYLSQGQYYP
ncbi:MAG: hypothetical protein SNJ56_06645, partial [Termitinemataceae bacterium]